MPSSEQGLFCQFEWYCNLFECFAPSQDALWLDSPETSHSLDVCQYTAPVYERVTIVRRVVGLSIACPFVQSGRSHCDKILAVSGQNSLILLVLWCVAWETNRIRFSLFWLPNRQWWMSHQLPPLAVVRFDTIAVIFLCRRCEKVLSTSFGEFETTLCSHWLLWAGTGGTRPGEPFIMPNWSRHTMHRPS